MLLRLFACALLFVLAVPNLRAADPTLLDPRGLPGPIVLTGGKEVPKDVRDAFFDLAGKEKARIVVIPWNAPIVSP